MRYDSIADLDLEIDSYSLERRQRETSSGFTRVSTVVSIHGGGETGTGEDVTYDGDEHEKLLQDHTWLSLPETETFDDFAEWTAGFDFFPRSTPSQSIYHNYRQWAFESAALDLALKQAGTNLAAALDEEYEPVRFVVSTRLREPPTGDRVLEWLDRNPALEFKLDPTSEWTEETIQRLAETGAVRVLDLKGKYEGTTVDQPPDPELYERVVEQFGDVLIEDPALTEQTRPLFDGHEHRVTWDYPIKHVESIEKLPWEPEWLNIKPSRFGSVRSLLESIEYCQERSITLFGGGQFELDVGREHLHAIASLFYPDSPNDVAPSGYNDPVPSANLPESPLEPPEDPRGLSW